MIGPRAVTNQETPLAAVDTRTGWTGVIAFLIQGFTAVEAEKVLEQGMGAVTEVSAEVAKEADKPEAFEVAEEVHGQVAEKVVAQVLETVQQKVTETVQEQGGQGERLQEKVEEIVMEKVAEAVQKKPRRFSSKPKREPRKRRMSCDEPASNEEGIFGTKSASALISR
jgi:hypothetical protein